MLPSESINPICILCERPLGEMNIDEFAALVIREGNAGKCFDCEPDRASLVPDLFFGKEDGDCFQIGEMAFTVDDHELKSVPHALAQAPARSISSCLSSVTYLHNTRHKEDVLGDGRVIGLCGECGGRGYFEEYGKPLACDNCSTVGAVEVAVIIPKWLLGGGCENV